MPDEAGVPPTHTALSTRVLWLEIDTGRSPITGRLCSEHTQWRFSGWIELGAALHSATTSGRCPS